MRHPRIAIAAAAVAALALAGCGSGDAGEGSSELLSTVEDTMYGPVEIQEPDGDLTVVALGWSDAEVALALGVTPVAASDWMGFGEETNGVGSWAADLYDGDEPTLFTDPGSGYDYEVIASLEPDVILNTRAAADEEQYTNLSSIAPTVYAPEGTADYGTSWDVQVTQVAQALGLQDEGDEIIADVESTIADAAAAHPEFEGVTATTGTKFGDQYGAYIEGDFRWDLLAELGFEQNPPVLELEPQGFYVPLSAEQIGALDAEVAVFFPIGYTLDEMLDDPLVSSLQVVQDDRVVFLESTDEVAQAFSAASPLSIPIAVESISDQLGEILA